MRNCRFVFIGLSITSSWGNGHATTYRALIRALTARGHDVTFLERDVPWYAEHRDLPKPSFCRTALYGSLAELKEAHAAAVAEADVVLVGSYVPQGVEVGRWVNDTARGITAFYDIDTPVTLAKLSRCECEYLSPDLIPRYNVYLSFTGGPTLLRLQREFGSPMARPLYCSVDAERYQPRDAAPQWDLGYLGTYSHDRQPTVRELLIKPAARWDAGRFIVAGPQYPASINWPVNVQRIDHLPPDEHPVFYSSQRFTLNVTRTDMRRAGYSPSVRLFEAAACGTPIISDYWNGLDELFHLGEELLVARCANDVLQMLREMPESQRHAIGQAARRRVLASHTAEHRAEELENHVIAALNRAAKARPQIASA